MSYVCTGCSLLCDDIRVTIENNRIKDVRNACLKGTARIRGCGTRQKHTVNRQETGLSSAVKKAAEILRNAKNPILFGWGNSTNGAQIGGITLAKKLNAIIDDNSSFCQGIMLEQVLRNRVRSCTLDDVRNNADVVVFWGSDAQNSQPRFLSRFAYYPRGEKRQKGYEESRNSIAIDVRESATAGLCKTVFRIPPRGDREFILAILDALDGKLPKLSYGIDGKKVLEFANVLKKAEFGAIFPGLGLTYSIKEDIDLMVRLMQRLNDFAPFHLVPMVGHYNMRGFNRNLFRETGYLNRVKFKDGKAVCDNSYSVIESLKNRSVDAALVIGSDPLSSLPYAVSRNLCNIPLIAIDPCRTLASEIADVTICTAVSGVESGGKAVRMDGVEIALEPMIKSAYPSDEEVLNMLTGEI